MKPYVGIVKFHYLKKDGECNETFAVHLYDIQEFERTISLYKYLMDNEIECAFNKFSEEIPEEWGHLAGASVFIEDVIVSIGTDKDLWAIEVYVK